MHATAHANKISTSPASLQYPFGLASPAQLQSLGGFLPSASPALNAGVSPTFGLPQAQSSPADLEHLIEALRLAQISNSQFQQNQSSLSSLLPSSQLQNLNQISAFRNLHNRTLSGLPGSPAITASGMQNYDLPMSHMQSNHLAGISPTQNSMAQFASLSGAGLGHTAPLSDASIMNLNYMQSHSHASLPSSYLHSQSQQQQQQQVFSPASTASASATASFSPASHRSNSQANNNFNRAFMSPNSSNAATGLPRLPTLLRYVPPPARVNPTSPDANVPLTESREAPKDASSV